MSDRGDPTTLLRYALPIAVAGIAMGVLLAYFASRSPLGEAAIRQGEGRQARPAGSELGTPSSTAVREAPVRKVTLPAIPGDSTHPDYDPVILRRANNLSTREVFDAEARDDSWAPLFEAKLEGILSEDLPDVLPGCEVEAVECRASSCRVTISGPVEMQDNLMFAFPGPALGNEGGIGSGDLRYLSDDEISVSYTLLMSRENRDPSTYDAWYAAKRADLLERIADEGGLPNGVPLPAR
jgi:hypothetical protein